LEKAIIAFKESNGWWNHYNGNIVVGPMRDLVNKVAKYGNSRYEFEWLFIAI